MNLAITGATSGIGKETVKGLAPKFQKIFLLVRNKEKAEKLIAELTSVDDGDKFLVIYCDLTKLDTIVAAADQIKSHTDHLNVLINNAGSVFKEKKLTKDGFEFSFCTNHLGHFLLTRKLMPLLTAAGSSRIINVSSQAHKIAKPDWEDLQSKESYAPLKVYANVKLYNILFTRALAERYGDNGVHAFALHPGMVRTAFGSGFKGIIKWGMKIVKPLLTSPKKGAQTSINLATSPSVLDYNGGYFKKSKLSSPSKDATSKELRNLLWKKSEELIQPWD